MSDATRRLHLGVAIDGAGQHPAAWRADADPGDTAGATAAPVTAAAVVRGETYVQRAKRAEAGLFDFVMLDDSLVVQPGTPLPLEGRLDALLTLARVAPETGRVGLVASVPTIHTEPFNVAKNIATLDWVSLGRAGWRPLISTDAAEYALFGRREPAPATALYAEAGDVVDVVARLCDSWEDGAIIRDEETGRYIDRDKVHYVDFEGPFFKVRGPSITPRSPQAQPLVVIDAAPGSGDDPATAGADALAARWADVIIIDAATPDAARVRRSAVLAAVDAAGRNPDEVFVLGRIEVLLGATETEARSELAALDRHAPWPSSEHRFRFVGSAEDLAGTLEGWTRMAATDGFVVLPARLPRDLDPIVDVVVPLLGHAGVFRTVYEGTQLRHHFGLPRPRNRYATDA